MTRFEDWPELLHAFLAERERVPFAWGGQNCVLFPADAVLAMTGIDHAAVWRGRRLTQRKAWRIARHGVEALANAALGEPILPTLAQRGDVVSLEIEGRVSLAICVGEVAVGPGAEGLIYPPMTTARAAWRV